MGRISIGLLLSIIAVVFLGALIFKFVLKALVFGLAAILFIGLVVILFAGLVVALIKHL